VCGTYLAHPILIYFLYDYVNLLGNNINTIKENIETLRDAGKEVGLEVITEKFRHIVACRPAAGQRPRGKQTYKEPLLSNAFENKHVPTETTELQQ
jgi:hypothetical protein